MMAGTAARRSRPFRALAGLLLLFGLWLGWRLPQMDMRLAEIAALLAPKRAVSRPTPAPAPPPAVIQSQPMLSPALPAPAAMGAPAEPVLMPEVPAVPPAITPPPTDPAPQAAPAIEMPDTTAFGLAQRAYDRLRAGDRRQAAALFDAAIRLQPDQRQWQADRAALGRHWQLGSFALLRDGGSAAFNSAASPVLGGGQLGGSIAFLPDPYARRPLALVVRGNIAVDPAGIRPETAQAAIGVRQALLPGVSISAERLIAIGAATRSDWTLRLAAGGGRGRLSAYGEAGVLGSGQAYAGAQASARLVRIGPATIAAGAWGSLQTGTPDVWRVDLGPAVSTQWQGVRLQADWRQRVAGNAAPGSGPAITISTGF